MGMTNEEQKLILIDNYVNLMRIKRAVKEDCEELDYQIQALEVKLTAYSIDLSKLQWHS